MPRPRLHPRPQQLPEASVSFRAIRPATSTAEHRQPIIRSRANISNACLTCKQRKRKCLGGQPCPGCVSADTECLYDEALDRRRKFHNDRARAESDFQRRLLRGLLTALKGEKSNVILDMIRADASFEELAVAIDSSNITKSPVHPSMQGQYESVPSPPSATSTSDHQPHSQLGQKRGQVRMPNAYHHDTTAVEPKSLTTLPTFQELNASLVNSASLSGGTRLEVRL